MGAKHGKPADAKKMLASIDMDSPDKADKKCDEMFAKFDKDKSGKLTGAEFDALLKEVVGYAKEEFKTRFPEGSPYGDDMLNEWVKAWLDPDGNGCDKEEMKTGIKFIVNYND